MSYQRSIDPPPIEQRRRREGGRDAGTVDTEVTVFLPSGGVGTRVVVLTVCVCVCVCEARESEREREREREIGKERIKERVCDCVCGEVCVRSTEDQSTRCSSLDHSLTGCIMDLVCGRRVEASGPSSLLAAAPWS